MSTSIFTNNLNSLQEEACISDYSVQKLNSLINSEEFDLQQQFRIIENNVNSFTLEYNGTNSNFVPLTSKRNPQAQALRSVENSIKEINDDKKHIIVIIGFTAWELLTTTMKKFPEALIVVIDPFFQPSKLFLETISFDDFFANDLSRLKLITADNLNDISTLFANILGEVLDFELSIIPDYGAVRIDKEKLLEIGKIIKSTVNIRTTDILTFDHYAEEWMQNQLKSLLYVINNPSLLQLRDKFTEIDAIVVAAGPSLSRAIPYLKKVANKAIIISVGTALKTLLKNGITPQFSIAIDSSKKTVTQFDDIALDGTIGILSPMLQTRLLDKFNGNAFYFSSHNLSIINEWLTLADSFKVMQLAAAGTISITALDCANFFGCKNIYAIGLDLAYNNDGSTHAKGGIYDSEKAQKNNTVKVVGNYQDYVTAHPTFSRYITQTANYLSQAKRQKCKEINFYNVTDAGAKIDNFKLLNFADFIDVFDKNNKNNSAKPDDYYQLAHDLIISNKNYLNNKLKDEVDDLKTLTIKEFQKLINNIDEIQKLYKRFERGFNPKIESKITNIENDFKNYSYALKLLGNTISQAHHAFGFLDGKETMSGSKKIKGFYSHLKKQILIIMDLLKKGDL